MERICRTVLAWLYVFWATVSAAGAENHALSVQDALDLRSFPAYFPVDFSPDGKWLAYTVRDTKRLQSSNHGDSQVFPGALATNIYIVDVTSGETKNITGGQGDNWLPAWSPDGRYVAFLSTRGGTGQGRLWLWQKSDGELRQVSDLSVGMMQGDRIQWTPDGSKVVFATLEQGTSAGQHQQAPSTSAQKEIVGNELALSTVILYQAPRYPLEDDKSPRLDPWDLDSYLRQLAVVNVNSGESAPTLPNRRIGTYTLSPNGLYVAYTSPKRFERAGSQQILFDLVVFSLADGKERLLAHEMRLNLDGTGYSWSPDSSQVVVHAGGIEERNNDCFVVEAKTGNSRNVTNLEPLQQRAQDRSARPLWDSHSDSIYFVHEGTLWRAASKETHAVQISSVPRRRIAYLISERGNRLWTADGGRSTVVVTHDGSGKEDGIYRVDLTSGTVKKLLESNQCLTCVFGLEEYVTIASGAGRAAYFAEDAQHESDVWVADSEFQTPKRLTHLNPEIDGLSLGGVRLVEWLSADGQPLKGALLLPAHYQSGKRYPMVVWIPGTGSMSDAFNQFGFAGSGPFNMQLFATRGYAVLMPDAPQHLGTPVLDMAKTVLPGVNKVIELGIADPDRIGVMGHSRGGYNTLALLVQTTRFRAAVVADGYADLVSAYGQMGKRGEAYQTSVSEHGLGMMGGTPWEYRERYLENSPVFYLDRVETPILIAHGAGDSSLGAWLGDQIFVSLRRLGKEVEYAKYQGEGHSPPAWRYQNKVDFCNRAISWFDEHLKK